MQKPTIPPGYKTQAEDTTPEAEIILYQMLRNLPQERRVQQMMTLNKQLRAIFWENFGKKYSTLTQRARKLELIKLELGETFCQIDRLVEKDFMLETPIELAAAIAKILEELNIPYFVGGGLASSILGEVRTTIDADLAILLEETDASQLIEKMQSDFYISETAVEDALRYRTNTFNVIHLTSALKADIYLIRGDDNFRKTALTRRTKVFPTDSPSLSFYICSAEDIILQKLTWYCIARNKSDKQWRDILGVLKLQGYRLDFDYLKYWSAELKVTEECDRALTESGLSNPSS
ncbi:MAG: hypothetical protein SXA11_03675 [Cyanobacteriota bacterium]|nr:hypothetical protein [Cyanobacteriota bacterium]